MADPASEVSGGNRRVRRDNPAEHLARRFCGASAHDPKDPGPPAFALSFRRSVAHGSVDYRGLGRVINTVIATQAQGLAHSEVITCSPVDCSPSLCHTRRNTPLRKRRAKSHMEIAIKKFRLNVTLFFLDCAPFSFVTCSFC